MFSEFSPFLDDIVHTGFKFRERREPVIDTLLDPVSSSVVQRAHERRSPLPISAVRTTGLRLTTPSP